MSAELSHTVDDLRRGATRPRAVVMTMGALHDGHAELIRQARERSRPNGDVVVTVFVNPTQFGAGEDFDAYPRTLDSDVDVAAAAGADVVFAPNAIEVYGPTGGFGPHTVTVDPGPLGDILEGASRPGHFRGVLTVVAKLMGMTTPAIALFGEKDYQQLTLIRRMVRDLNLPVDVVGVPTVREPDGLARSSRNRYLSSTERAIAATIPHALDAAVDAGRAGPQAALDAGRAALDAVPEVALDYLVVTDPDLGPAPEVGDSRILIAAMVGGTRLIDNRPARMGE
ncbi:MAG: pantoate--beta-alanine ligase [Candidatus Nanopelagicales bacterium]